MNDGNMWDPALVQQLVALGNIPDQQAMASRKMDRGAEMAGMAMPKGAQVGNVYMASSPLEHLAAAIQKGVGYAREGRGENEYRGLVDQQTQGRNAYAAKLAQLLQSQNAPVSPVAAGGSPLMGMGKIN